MSTEIRQFRMHSKLLYDVILSQAGTLSKAILEGIMNSVDAGAETCRVTCDERSVRIEDDGRGFRSRQEIEDWFEEFGHPHEAEENKTYGTFRMGRGQLFAFGRNYWKTGAWQMTVDIKDLGLDYELAPLKPAVKGCRILVDLYNRLLPSALYETRQQVIQWAKYANIALYYNDELVSVRLEDEAWDHVLEEAYIRLKSSGSLEVYNLGIHTLDLAGWRMGSGGIVVSRKQLQVNFARNSVMDSCPVWRKIKPFLSKEINHKIRRKTRLSDDERQRLVDALLAGEAEDCEDDFARHKLFTAVSGKPLSAGQLGVRDYGYRLTACEAGSVLGDKLYQQQAAVVLSDETLERFHVGSVPELLEVLRATPLRYFVSSIKPVDFAELAADLDPAYVRLDSKQLRPTEKLWLDLANGSLSTLVRKLAPVYRDQDYEDSRDYYQELNDFYREHSMDRRIVVGVGPADGWTDGTSYIAVARDFLGRLKLDVPGYTALGHLLLHELCHNDASSATHIHSHEFYQLYHDWTARGAVGAFAWRCVQKLPQALKRQNRKPTQGMLRQLDHLAAAGQTVAAAAGSCAMGASS